MKKKFIGTLLTLSMLALTPISSYAGWEQEGSQWRYYNEALGQYQTGDFIDTDGNIYYFDQNGYMVADTLLGSTYQYFGLDGKLRVCSEDLYGIFAMFSEKYLAGEEIELPSFSSLVNWWWYFNRYYNDYNMTEEIPFTCTGPGEGYKPAPFSEVLRTYYNEDKSNTSDLVQSTVKQLADGLSSLSVDEATTIAAQRVCALIDYDYDNFDSETSTLAHDYGLEEVIQNKKGVCVAYAELTIRVLREAGITAEMVDGLVYREDGSSGGHAWVRVDINQKDESLPEHWRYVDPTGADSKSAEQQAYYLNYPYDALMTNRIIYSQNAADKLSNTLAYVHVY